MVSLKAGDVAPAFEGVTTDGKRVSLSDYRGRKLVLYFYPKDDTPGCTRQACSLRDGMGSLASRGVAVLGVSTQDAQSHAAFTRKFNLNFPLLADVDGAVARAYGTLGGHGPIAWLKAALKWSARRTFVIDESGRIAHVIDKPDVSRHAEEVLALL